MDTTQVECKPISTQLMVKVSTKELKDTTVTSPWKFTDTSPIPKTDIWPFKLLMMLGSLLTENSLSI